MYHVPIRTAVAPQCRNLDLIVVPNTPEPASILFRNMGTSPPTFTKLPITTIVPGNRAAWADVDGDGDLDLLICTGSSTSNMLYRNLGGNLGFEEWTASAINSETSHYATNHAIFADYDGDGDVDLFMATDVQNVLWRNVGGAGLFERVTGWPFTEGPTTNSNDAAFVDYDGDGDLDLFVANGQIGTSTKVPNFLYQNVNGVFKKVTGVPVTSRSELTLAAAFGDFDNDGDLDLVTVDYLAEHGVFENAVDGEWHLASTGTLVEGAKSSRGGAWADVDGDGDLDLVVVNDGVANELFLNVAGEHKGSEFVLEAASAVSTDVDVTAGRGAAFADYSGDGKPDLVVVNGGANVANFLYLNDGTGGLTRVTDAANPVTTDLADSRAACWGDVDKDGQADLLIANAGGDNALYTRAAGGGFQRASTPGELPSNTDDTVACAFGDLNGDGWLDLVVVSSDPAQNNGYYLNDGTAKGSGTRFGAMQILALPTDAVRGSSQAVALGNLGGPSQTDLDIIIVNKKASAGAATITSCNYVYLNSGGTLTPVARSQQLTTDEHESVGVALADFNADGFLDVFVLGEGSNRLYMNDKGDNGDSIASLVTTGALVTQGDLGAKAVAAGDYDMDGDADLYIFNNGLNRLYTYRHCESGARLGPFSGCFNCAGWARRPSSADVCYECEPDAITGGLSSENSCQFACPLGLARPTGQDSCALCPTGHYYNDSISRANDIVSPRCSPCAPGTAADGTIPAIGKCYDCAAGTFAANSGAATCSACATGEWTAGQAGQSGCTDCSAGGYCVRGNSGRITYTTCSPGTYSATSGASDASVCLPCRAGTYNALEGRTALSACRACNPGSYSAGGVAECSFCEPGTQQASASASGCNPCSDGSHGSYCPEGSRFPVLCPGGTYSSAAANVQASDCTDCPQGSYCPPGSTNSTPCQEGTFSSTTRSISCSLCAAGTYQPASGQSGCIACGPGYYCPSGGTAAVPCPAGTFSSTPGLQSASDCSPCPKGSACEMGVSAPSPCRKGEFANVTGLPVCFECAPGTFQDGAGESACKSCAAGAYCVRAAFAELPCPAGTYATAPGLRSAAECNACDAGSWCPPGATAPTPCAPGTFASAQGVSACTACTAGSFQDASGQTSCKACSPGSYCPQAASGELPCPEGTYSNTPSLSGVVQCTACPFGSFCPAGATVATPCAPGTYINNTSAAVCTKCAAGTYQAASGQTGCDACAPGYYCPEGASSKVACEGGTYDNSGTISAQAQCSDCPAGSHCPVGATAPILCNPGEHAPAPRSTVCALCPQGTYQKAPGQTTCLPCATENVFCPAGSRLPVMATATCTAGQYYNAGNCDDCTPGRYCPLGAAFQSPCEAGSYSASFNASVCPLCDAGMYQDLTMQTACKSCPLGRYCPSGSPRAVECPAGEYQDATSQSACKTCPAGSYCPSGSTVPVPCRPGSYAGAPGAAECTVCALGKAQALAGRSQCDDCAPGSFAPTTGRVVCALCTPGTAQPATGSVACDPCPIGFAAAEAGLSTCPACAPGTFQSANGSRTCTQCPVGKAQPLVGGSDCEACAPGKAMALPGASVCDTCPRGTRQHEQGATVCVRCAEGQASPEGHNQSACDPCGKDDPTQRTAVTGEKTTYGGWAPFGIACPDGKLLGVLAGHWAENNGRQGEPLTDSNVKGTRAFACVPAKACLGGIDSKCATGHEGLLCADCAFGYQKGIDGLCIPSTVGGGGGNGSSSGAATSAAYVVQTAFQLDMALADFDEDAFRAALARQYGVPLSAIGVSASAGSVVVSVTISLRDASDAAQVSASILATPDAALATTLGIPVTRTAEPTVEESGLPLWAGLLVLLGVVAALCFLIMGVVAACLCCALADPNQQAAKARAAAKAAAAGAGAAVPTVFEPTPLPQHTQPLPDAEDYSLKPPLSPGLPPTPAERRPTADAPPPTTPQQQPPAPPSGQCVSGADDELISPARASTSVGHKLSRQGRPAAGTADPAVAPSAQASASTPPSGGAGGATAAADAVATPAKQVVSLAELSQPASDRKFADPKGSEQRRSQRHGGTSGHRHSSRGGGDGSGGASGGHHRHSRSGERRGSSAERCASSTERRASRSGPRIEEAAVGGASQRVSSASKISCFSPPPSPPAEGAEPTAADEAEPQEEEQPGKEEEEVEEEEEQPVASVEVPPEPKPLVGVFVHRDAPPAAAEGADLAVATPGVTSFGAYVGAQLGGRFGVPDTLVEEELPAPDELRAIAAHNENAAAQIRGCAACVFFLSEPFFSDARSVQLLTIAMDCGKPIVLVVAPNARWGEARDLRLPDNAHNPRAVPYVPALAPAFASARPLFWEAEYAGSCFSKLLDAVTGELERTAQAFSAEHAEWAALAAAVGNGSPVPAAPRPKAVDWTSTVAELEALETKALKRSAERPFSGWTRTFNWLEKALDVYVVHRVDERREVALQIYSGLHELGYNVFMERLGLASHAAIKPAMEAAGTVLVLLTRQIFESYWCAVELLAAAELHAEGKVQLLLLPVQGESFYEDDEDALAAGSAGGVRSARGFPSAAMVMKNYAVWFPGLAHSVAQHVERLFGGGEYTASRMVTHSSEHYKAFERHLAARIGMSARARLLVNDLLATAPPSALGEADLVARATELVRSVDEANCLQAALHAPARFHVLKGKAVAPEERAKSFLKDALKLNIVQGFDGPTMQRVAARLDTPAPGENLNPLRHLHVAEVIEVHEDGHVLPYEHVRAIEVEAFPPLLRLLRLRAEEADKVRSNLEPPADAPAAFSAWADLETELPTTTYLRGLTVRGQMVEPSVAVAKLLLAFVQVAGSFFATFPEHVVAWPQAPVPVAMIGDSVYAWLNLERLFSPGVFSAFGFLDLQGGVRAASLTAKLNYANTTFGYMCSLLTAFVCLPLSAYLLACARSLRYIRTPLLDRAKAIGIWVALVAYPGINVRLLGLFVPRAFGGRYVLQADPSLAYASIEWARYAAYGFILLLTVGIPLVLMLGARRAKRRDEAPPANKSDAALASKLYQTGRDRLKFGVLTALYAPHLWWWEGWELLRKTLLSGFIAPLVPGTALQLWLGVLACQAALLAAVYARPFVVARLNLLNFVSLACLLLLLVCGLAYHAEYAGVSAPSAALASLGQALPYVLIAALFLPLALGLLLLATLLRDARRKRREALARWAAQPAIIRDEVPAAILEAEAARQRLEAARMRKGAMVRHELDQARSREGLTQAKQTQAQADAAVTQAVTESRFLAPEEAAAEMPLPLGTPAPLAQQIRRGSAMLAANVLAAATAMASSDDAKDKDGDAPTEPMTAEEAAVAAAVAAAATSAPTTPGARRGSVQRRGSVGAGGGGGVDMGPNSLAAVRRGSVQTAIKSEAPKRIQGGRTQFKPTNAPPLALPADPAATPTPKRRASISTRIGIGAPDGAPGAAPPVQGPLEA